MIEIRLLPSQRLCCVSLRHVACGAGTALLAAFLSGGIERSAHGRTLTSRAAPKGAAPCDAYGALVVDILRCHLGTWPRPLKIRQMQAQRRINRAISNLQNHGDNARLRPRELGNRT